MTESMCPSLHRLGSRLRTAYGFRETSRANKNDVEANAKAERDLLRLHKLITHHHVSCRFCQSNDRLRSLPDYKDSRSDKKIAPCLRPSGHTQMVNVGIK
jgi:hypothetical protein